MLSSYVGIYIVPIVHERYAGSAHVKLHVVYADTAICNIGL